APTRAAPPRGDARTTGCSGRSRDQPRTSGGAGRRSTVPAPRAPWSAGRARRRTSPDPRRAARPRRSPGRERSRRACRRRTTARPRRAPAGRRWRAAATCRSGRLAGDRWLVGARWHCRSRGCHVANRPAPRPGGGVSSALRRLPLRRRVAALLVAALLRRRPRLRRRVAALLVAALLRRRPRLRRRPLLHLRTSPAVALRVVAPALSTEGRRRLTRGDR